MMPPSPSDSTSSIQVVASHPAGTLKNRAVTLSHLRRCQCAIFLINLHDRASFDIAKYLFDEYRSNWSGNYTKNCLLLANQAVEQSGAASKGLIIDQRSIDNHSRQSAESTRSQVEEFCRQNEIEYEEMNVETNPKAAKETVERYLLQFCKANYNSLMQEKKHLEKDSGSSCNLI